jgi:hypothetical protein
MLDDMLAQGLGVRESAEPMSSDARVVTAGQLKALLAEQREMLSAAVERHEEMLERMRRETARGES